MFVWKNLYEQNLSEADDSSLKVKVYNCPVIKIGFRSDNVRLAFKNPHAPILESQGLNIKWTGPECIGAGTKAK